MGGREKALTVQLSTLNFYITVTGDASPFSLPPRILRPVSFMKSVAHWMLNSLPQGILGMLSCVSKMTDACGRFKNVGLFYLLDSEE